MNINKYNGSGENIQYLKENQQVIDNILSKMFFDEWRAHKPTDKCLELIISPECNLGCTYCYIAKYHEKLYPHNIYNIEQTKKNLYLILQWLDKNHFRIPLDIFSGEFFAQKIGWEIMDIIYEYEKNVNPEWRITSITIPTNFTFCNDDNLIKKILELREEFKLININLYLSASFDGLYEEQNRPWIKDLDIIIPHTRDNTYYDKVFKFAADTSSGLHPMIYSHGIEKWKDNFLWFQSMMEKYNIPWYHLYLLEVRNPDWNIQQIKSFQDFIEFLWEWSYNKCDRDKEKLKDFLYEKQGFNLLMASIARTTLGLTCGLQMELSIRLGDLKLCLCHRTAYEEFICGELIPDNQEILKINCTNPELFITTYGLHHRNMAHCVSCPINHLCCGQCLGACYEENKNMFIPIPSVCQLEHAKALTTIKMFLKYGLYEQFIAGTTMAQKAQIEWLRKEIIND